MRRVLRAVVRSKLLSHLSVYGGVVMLFRDPRSHAGLSRVEVLVLVLIQVAIAGMILSGVQRSRENGRRAECANNLRNIGFAALAYEAAAGHLPSENPKDNPDYPTGGTCPSFYAQLCDNLQLASALKNADDPTQGARPAPHNQVQVFICPSRRTMQQAPGGRDYGYLRSNGVIQAVLDYPGTISLRNTEAFIALHQIALLGHVWVSPESYIQLTPNPSWATPYPAHAMTDSTRIYPDKDPSGKDALGTPHTVMPTLFADNHIGNLPVSYPQLAALFSIALRPEPLKNVP
jgi:hypothetical protein